MLTGLTTNERGTPVAEGVCDTCGERYTVCPPPEPDHYGCWSDCLRPECGSYDVERDADIWFEAMADHGLVRQEHRDKG